MGDSVLKNMGHILNMRHSVKECFGQIGHRSNLNEIVTYRSSLVATLSDGAEARLVTEVSGENVKSNVFDFVFGEEVHGVTFSVSTVGEDFILRHLFITISNSASFQSFCHSS